MTMAYLGRAPLPHGEMRDTPLASRQILFSRLSHAGEEGARTGALIFDVGAGTLERNNGATISKSRLEAQMDQPSRKNGTVTKWQQSKGVNFFPALIVCLSLLVFTGSPASANQWSYPGDPGFVATTPSEVAAARLSWQTPEYGT